MEDELIDNAIDSVIGYLAAKKELNECYEGCDYDSFYFCQQEQQDLDEYRNDIKKHVLELIKAAT